MRRPQLFMKYVAECHHCGPLCRHELSLDGDGIRLVGPDCSYCENTRRLTDCTATLAHNLAIAAGLCHAWRLGRVALHLERLPNKPLKPWSPGCGRRAAGWSTP